MLRGICPAASSSPGNMFSFKTDWVTVIQLNAKGIDYPFLALPLLRSATSNKIKTAPPTIHIQGC